MRTLRTPNGTLRIRGAIPKRVLKEQAALARIHYAPPEPHYRPPHIDEGGGGQRALAYIVMAVVVVAFGGAVWNIYGVREPPHIPAPIGAYRVAPSEEAARAPEPVEQNAMYDALEGRTDADTGNATPRPAPEAPLATTAPAGPPQIAEPPSFAANGPYVAQVAALQSENAVGAAWQRLSSRAPQLFAPARMDVERADLGQRGVYFRVRAGYFADRVNASRFCDRVKQLGQDCIVVAR